MISFLSSVNIRPSFSVSTLGGSSAKIVQPPIILSSTSQTKDQTLKAQVQINISINSSDNREDMPPVSITSMDFL